MALVTSLAALLYHYTTAEGLLGIVGSNTLLATDAEFLNDAQEMQFGRATVHEALLARAAALDPRPNPMLDTSEASRAMVIRSAADHLVSPVGGATEPKWYAVYVACFCEDGDLLSQWRGYGKGGGYALGFDAEVLSSATLGDGLPSHYGPSLIKVRYGVDQVDRVATEVLAVVGQTATGHPGVHGFFEAGQHVLPALASVKDPAFREEQEWRIVVSSERTGVRFRQTPVSIAPYVVLQLPTDALRAVIVGPGPHADLRRDAVERLVTGRRFEFLVELPEVEVSESSAPFRG